MCDNFYILFSIFIFLYHIKKIFEPSSWGDEAWEDSLKERKKQERLASARFYSFRSINKKLFAVFVVVYISALIFLAVYDH